MLEPLRNPANWDNFRKAAVLVLINIMRPHRADEFSVYIERDPFSTILD